MLFRTFEMITQVKHLPWGPVLTSPTLIKQFMRNWLLGLLVNWSGLASYKGLQPFQKCRISQTSIVNDISKHLRQLH